MGTRHLIAVIADGERRVSQYGQWDGYPSGQGLRALHFLRAMDEAKFRERLKACIFRDDAWWRQRWIDAGAKPDQEFVDMELSNKFHQQNPFKDRDHGARILSMIAESAGPVDLADNWAFAANSLFCEFAYVIDLDKRTLEVYSGFNKSPLPPGERFSDMPLYRPEHWVDNEYFPVKHLATFSLDALPTDEDFLKATEQPDEAEEAA